MALWNLTVLFLKPNVLHRKMTRVVFQNVNSTLPFSVCRIIPVNSSWKAQIVTQIEGIDIAICYYLLITIPLSVPVVFRVHKEIRIIQSTCSSNVSCYACCAPPALRVQAGLPRNSLADDMDTEAGKSWAVAWNMCWADCTSSVIGFSSTTSDMVPYGAGGHYFCGSMQLSLYYLYH